MNAHRTMRAACGMVIAVTLLCLATTVSNLSIAKAQSFYGSVVGTVSDSSGGVIPNSTVTLTNLGTNEKRVATTDAAGNYRFVNLVPANYKVEVESGNFKRFMRQGVQVTVDTTVRVDAALEVGATSETVEVTTQAALLQTESGSLGDTVESKQVAEMPLNGRNTLSLMALVPGVVPQGNTGGSAAMNNAGQGTSSAAWGNFQIGGGMPLQSSMYIDGAPISILNKNFTALVPTQDIIQEFKVETSGVSAEFGRFGGGIVNMTTKSGTNAFHGSAYEYIRNQVVNANTFFNKRNGVARAPWTQNQFGGFVGGPIWKDKAFFFFSWEEIHIRAGSPFSTNIPTAAMQNGVIPEVYDSTGKLLNGINTTTGLVDPRGKCNTVWNKGNAAAPGNWTITNLSSCIDPTAQKLATFYPTATLNPNATTNYNTTVGRGVDGHQVTGRVDWKIGNNNQFFSRFTLWPLVDLSQDYMKSAGGWNSAGAQTHNHTNQIVAGDTYTINPTTLLDVRIDYLRQYGDAIPPGFGSVKLSDFGPAYAAIEPYATYKNFPAWTFSGGTQAHALYNFSYNNITRTFYNNYHASAGITKILSKHSLKTGVEGRLIQRDDIGSDQAPTGRFTFSAKTLGGDEWSNFLFGAFDQGTITTVKATTTFNYYYGFYVQDTWQVMPKLTLNLGLRYELPGGPGENHDNATVLLPNTTDPLTGITGTVGLVSSALYDKRTTLIPIKNAIGPRAGFAYRLTPDTVIRGGYSLSYLPNDAQTGTWANNSPVNSASTINTNSAAAFSYTLSNPFPVTAQFPHGFGDAQGRANTSFMNNFIGGTVSAPNPTNPYPRSQAMNLSVGHQFPGDVLVDIGVAHSLGTHLAGISAGLDQLPSQYFACGADATLSQCGGHKLADALPTGSKLSYNGVSLPTAYQTYGQLLRPYKAYANYSDSADYHGTSSYNGLQVKVQKRFASAGQLGAAYTWAKMITDTDTILTSQETKSGGAGGNGEGLYQDYNNKKGERSLYSFDVPHRIVVNYVLNLPFGRNQHYLAGVHGVADKVVSGWSVNGITTYQTGYPLYLNTSGNNLSKFFGAGTIRPNYTAGCTKSNSISWYDATLATASSAATARQFNTSCFTLPNTPGQSGAGTATSYGFGNEPRVDNALRGQSQHNWDFSVVKSTNIHENIAAQFRVEFFNIFNRTQFAPPVTQTDSTQFGLILGQANNPRLVQGALRINF